MRSGVVIVVILITGIREATPTWYYYTVSNVEIINDIRLDRYIFTPLVL